MGADWIGWVLAGIGALIAGYSWTRRSVLGLIFGISLLAVAWYGLFLV